LGYIEGMETITTWTTSATPPVTPACNVNGEFLKHCQTSTSQHLVGWLWWKRVVWKHEFGYRSEREMSEEIEAVKELQTDASITLVSDSDAMPTIPDAPVGFEFTFADDPRQIMEKKWIHKFHYAPMAETHSASPL
jgi:hypothetical protein